MRELAVDQLLRAAHVKRWHIVRVRREQTVAEHSWLVTVLTREIAQRLHLDTTRGDGWMLNLIDWALFHDTPEVITGDLPTPTKELIYRKAGDDGLLVEDPITELERTTSKRWSELEVWATSTENGLPAAIVKIADLLESVRFLCIEAGDMHARSVISYLRLKLLRELAASSNLWSNLDYWPDVQKLVTETLYCTEAKDYETP